MLHKIERTEKNFYLYAGTPVQRQGVTIMAVHPEHPSPAQHYTLLQRQRSTSTYISYGLAKMPAGVGPAPFLKLVVHALH
jgi:hypothetical protein